jgi:hypothetical protein
MIRPEQRSFAPVEKDEDLPEDVLHWAQLFQDVASQRERDARRDDRKPARAAERLA